MRLAALLGFRCLRRSRGVSPLPCPMYDLCPTTAPLLRVAACRWDAVRRFSLLALALGRRAVLPLVPCELAPCAPRVPNPLRPYLYTATVTDRDAAACAEPPLPTPPPAGSNSSTTERDLAPRAVSAPLGWSPSPDTSKWWWNARDQPKRRAEGCCQPIPNFGKCIDPAGARRVLGTEPLLATADLARLLQEMRSTPPPGLRSARTIEEPLPSDAIATVTLDADWAEASLERLTALAMARVLVLDVRKEPTKRLPTVEWLMQHASGAAAQEAIGPHAARCFTALGSKQDGLYSTA